MSRRTLTAATLSVSIVLLIAVPALQGAAQVHPTIDVGWEILTTDTQDPLSVVVAPDGRVIWTEREGKLKVRTLDGQVVIAAHLDVSANACDDCLVQDDHPLEEGGLYSILLSPDFDSSGLIYLYRPIPGSRGQMPGYPEMFGYWRLSTFVLGDDNVLDLESETELLKVPAEWDHCCHYGGDLMWLPDGTILLTTGDDIPATSSMGFGPRDARMPAGSAYNYNDGEINVANPDDLRGKILRLMPDGSVPDGSVDGIAANPYIGRTGVQPYIRPNPDYAPGTPSTGFKYIRDASGPATDHSIAYNPYIYSLGYKQPFRGAVHAATGTAYFDDVGPDSYVDDPARGPRGHEELNVVPFGGGVNHGWPRCAADNRPYHDYDWATMTDNGPLDCSQMTGAVLYYPHDVSLQWPQLTAGLTTSMPVAVYPASQGGALRLPASFNDHLIELEFGRNFIFTIPVRADGTLDVSTTAVKRLTLPGGLPFAGDGGTIQALAEPIDATIGPDGALYLLEYGNGFYNSTTSRLSRLTCAGCAPDPSDYTAMTGPFVRALGGKASITPTVKHAERAKAKALKAARALERRVTHEPVARERAGEPGVARAAGIAVLAVGLIVTGIRGRRRIAA